MRIAIVKLSALGDIVHALVAVQFIKKHAPETVIDWVVEERFAQLLEHNPDINQVLPVNLRSLKSNKLRIFREIAKVCRYAKNQYDCVIDAQGLIKSAIVARLLGHKTVGFDSKSVREKPASWLYDIKVFCPYDENTIDRNTTALSQPFGLKITSADILAKRPFLFFNETQPQLDEFFPVDHKTIVFVIGSTWASRNYPPEKFVNIAQELKENCLVVWGNLEERLKANAMAKQCANIKVLPQLDLNGLKTVIARADLVIGNDTGPTHMAWALNKPSITIFGPTPVSRIYQTDINKAVKSYSTVNPYKLDKEDFSIKDIDEHTIISQARMLLAYPTR